MRHVWRDSWGPRSEYIAYNGIAALLDHSAKRGGISLLGLPRMFVDKQFRARVVARHRRSEGAEFLGGRVCRVAGAARSKKRWRPYKTSSASSSSVPVIRNVIGQATSTFSLDEVINGRQDLHRQPRQRQARRKSVVLLGSLLMTGFELAALRRQTIPEEEREDFALFVDEFQNFATDSFATYLSEARKFRLNLFLTHQYIGQLTDIVRRRNLRQRRDADQFQGRG